MNLRHVKDLSEAEKAEIIRNIRALDEDRLFELVHLGQWAEKFLEEASAEFIRKVEDEFLGIGKT